MASPRFDANILLVARRLQDPRTLVTDDGTRFTAQQLADYQNRAIKDLLTAKLGEAGTAFTDLFPEAVKTSVGVAIAGGELARPADSMIVLDVYRSNGEGKINRIPQDKVADVLTGEDLLIEPSTEFPQFYEEGTKIKFLPASMTDTVVVRYIQNHADLTINGASDILLNAKHDTEIQDRMVDLATKDTVRNTNG